MNLLRFYPAPALTRYLPLIFGTLLLVSACGGEEKEDFYSRQPDTIYDEFMNNLREQCGKAYAGELAKEPEGDEMLDGDEQLIAHFTVCEPDEDIVKIAFHIETAPGEWDRSRTWIFEQSPRGISLRHDHRNPDGSPAENTMYGGPSRGLLNVDGNRMEFVSVERTEESGIARGWRVLIEPGEHYVYGTYRVQDWSWRVDFDLTEPVETPPAAWGQEENSEV